MHRRWIAELFDSYLTLSIFDFFSVKKAPLRCAGASLLVNQFQASDRVIWHPATPAQYRRRQMGRRILGRTWAGKSDRPVPSCIYHIYIEVFRQALQCHNSCKIRRGARSRCRKLIKFPAAILLSQPLVVQHRLISALVTWHL